MKVIELLNKIANDEELPKKIKFESSKTIYELNDYTQRYIGQYMNNILILEHIDIESLNEENKKLKAEVDLLNDNRHFLNNKIGKAIIFIRKNIELNNGALSNREELIVSKHDLIKNETDVLNYLINILKGEENV